MKSVVEVVEDMVGHYRSGAPWEGEGRVWREPSVSLSTSGREASVSPRIGAPGEGEARGRGPRGVVEREESVELEEILYEAKDVLTRFPKSNVWNFFK